MRLKFDDVKEQLSLETKEFSVLLNQKGGSLTLEDKKKKSKVVLDAKGITLDAAENININTKKKLNVTAKGGVLFKPKEVKTK